MDPRNLKNAALTAFLKKAAAKYVTCVECGQIDYPLPPVLDRGHVVLAARTGTARVMQCPDCAGPDGHAAACRDCCPTGHGTHS